MTKTFSSGKNILERLKPLNDRIQEKLLSSIDDEFPRTLKDPIRYFLETPGKKIRPLLTLLCCQAVGGGVEDALPAAVGIELFHDFTLIHDDIMDQDELRRGRITIHKKWDEGTAILVGDALVGMAYTFLVQSNPTHLSEVVNLFSEGLIKVCEGQALDKEFESRSQVDMPEYLDMISKKTAWLFKLSCQIGAILGGATPEEVQTFAAFGHRLGIAFQVQDDLLDLIADENQLGKKVGSDFEMHKKTYLSVKYQNYIQNHPESASRYPEAFHRFASIEQLKDAMNKLGLVAEIRNDLDIFFQQALDQLKKVRPLDEKNEIYKLVQFLRIRQY